MATDPKNATAIKTGIIQKLKDLDKYADEELSDYIMVMIANKKHKDDMKRDLNLFLAEETTSFLSWLLPFLKDFERRAADKEHSQRWKPAMGGRDRGGGGFGRDRGRSPSPYGDSQRSRGGNRGLRALADMADDEEKADARAKKKEQDGGLSDVEDDKLSEVFSDKEEFDEEGNPIKKRKPRTKQPEIDPFSKMVIDEQQDKLKEKAMAGTLAGAKLAAGAGRNTTVSDDNNRRLDMAKHVGIIPRSYMPDRPAGDRGRGRSPRDSYRDRGPASYRDNSYGRRDDYRDRRDDRGYGRDRDRGYNRDRERERYERERHDRERRGGDRGRYESDRRRDDRSPIKNKIQDYSNEPKKSSSGKPHNTNNPDTSQSLAIKSFPFKMGGDRGGKAEWKDGDRDRERDRKRTISPKDRHDDRTKMARRDDRNRSRDRQDRERRHDDRHRDEKRQKSAENQPKKEAVKKEKSEEPEKEKLPKEEGEIEEGEAVSDERSPPKTRDARQDIRKLRQESGKKTDIRDLELKHRTKEEAKDKSRDRKDSRNRDTDRKDRENNRSNNKDDRDYHDRNNNRDRDSYKIKKEERSRDDRKSGRDRKYEDDLVDSISKNKIRDDKRDRDRSYQSKDRTTSRDQKYKESRSERSYDTRDRDREDKTSSNRRKDRDRREDRDYDKDRKEHDSRDNERESRKEKSDRDRSEHRRRDYDDDRKDHSSDKHRERRSSQKPTSKKASTDATNHSARYQMDGTNENFSIVKTIKNDFKSNISSSFLNLSQETATTESGGMDESIDELKQARALEKKLKKLKKAEKIQRKLKKKEKKKKMKEKGDQDHNYKIKIKTQSHAVDSSGHPLSKKERSKQNKLWIEKIKSAIGSDTRIEEDSNKDLVVYIADKNIKKREVKSILRKVLEDKPKKSQKHANFADPPVSSSKKSKASKNASGHDANTEFVVTINEKKSQQELALESLARLAKNPDLPVNLGSLNIKNLPNSSDGKNKLTSITDIYVHSSSESESSESSEDEDAKPSTKTQAPLGQKSLTSNLASQQKSSVTANIIPDANPKTNLPNPLAPQKSSLAGLGNLNFLQNSNFNNQSINRNLLQPAIPNIAGGATTYQQQLNQLINASANNNKTPLNVTNPVNPGLPTTTQAGTTPAVNNAYANAFAALGMGATLPGLNNLNLQFLTNPLLRGHAGVGGLASNPSIVAAAGQAAALAAVAANTNQPVIPYDPEADKKSIIVLNVHYQTTGKELEKHFEVIGPITRVTIVKDKITGQPKGMAYIQFESESLVESAKSLDQTNFFGRPITVMPKTRSLWTPTQHETYLSLNKAQVNTPIHFPGGSYNRTWVAKN